ncbi:hypothetical protein H8356DRAFT_1358358 [Neocallimastix lanati (nom. inval.)]|nr:hypothetical protein H8356DRAFT_1358358 [Neocallimastix sp. JGI-2020a]
MIYLGTILLLREILYFTNNFNNEFIEVNIKYNVKKCSDRIFSLSYNVDLNSNDNDRSNGMHIDHSVKITNLNRQKIK